MEINQKAPSDVKICEWSSHDADNFDKNANYLDMDKLVEYFNKRDVNGAHEYFLNYFNDVTDGNVDPIKTAINYGIDPRYRNDQLLILSCRKNLTLVKFFLDHCGCDVNAQDSEPLRTAIVHNNYDVFCHLLENGAIINSTITNLVHYYGFRYMDKLVEYGIPAETLFKSFLLNSHQGKGLLVILKYFSKYQIGLDALVNEIISQNQRENQREN